MSPRLLRLHKEMKPFKKSDGLGWDLNAALKKSPAVQKLYDKFERSTDDPQPRWKFLGLLHNIDRDIKKGYLRVLEPENYPMGYISKKAIFWNVSGWNAFCDETIDLVGRGEKWEKHKRRLWSKYHSRFQLKSCSEIKEVWDWISNDFKDPSEQERAQQGDAGLPRKGKRGNLRKQQSNHVNR